MKPVQFQRLIIPETALTAGFCGVLFRSGAVIVAGIGNLAFDFSSQAFRVALMGGLVPTLLARGRAGLRGDIAIPLSVVATPLAIRRALGGAGPETSSRRI